LIFFKKSAIIWLFLNKNMDSQDLIKEINEADLTSQEKQYWVARIEKEGASQDLIDELKDFLQKQLDEIFEKAGVGKDDEEYQKLEKAAAAKIGKLQKEFNETIDRSKKYLKKIEEAAITVSNQQNIQKARTKIKDI